MLTLISALRDPVLHFIDQKSKTIHLVAGTPFEQGALAKLTQDMDRGNRNDLFFISAEPFRDADQYLDHLAHRLDLHYREYLQWLDLQQELAKLAPAEAPSKTREPLPAKLPRGPKIPLAEAAAAKPRNPMRQMRRPPAPATTAAPFDPAKCAAGPKAKRASAAWRAEAAAVNPTTAAHAVDTSQAALASQPTDAASQPPCIATPAAPAVTDVASQPPRAPVGERGEDDLVRDMDAFLETHFPAPLREAVDNPSQEATAALIARLNPDKAPPPLALTDREIPAAERLRIFFDYCMGNLPEGGDHHFVFVLIPASNDHPEAWQDLLEATAAWPAYQSETPLRLLAAYAPAVDETRRAHEQAEKRAVRPLLPTLAHVQLQTLDLSEAARREAEEALVADPDTDTHDRMITLLSLAVRDGVEGRQPLAHQRFDRAAAYFEDVEQWDLVAFARAGRGDIYLRQNDWETARDWYRTALPPAVDSGNPFVLFHVSKNHGEAAFRAGNWEESARSFATAAHAAELVKDHPSQIAALERHAAACIKLQGWEPARATYEQAALLCRRHDIDEPIPRILRALKKVYTKQNRKPDWVAFSDHIESLAKGA